eukprot:520307-Prymnesium_polylepis.1
MSRVRASRCAARRPVDAGRRGRGRRFAREAAGDPEALRQYRRRDEAEAARHRQRECHMGGAAAVLSSPIVRYGA